MMEELVPQAQEAYRQSQKYITQTKRLNKNLESLEQTKGDLREAFLRTVDGRDDMPRSVSARKTEIAFLNKRIPDLMVEMNLAREALEKQEQRIEVGERAAARRVDTVEKKSGKKGAH